MKEFRNMAKYVNLFPISASYVKISQGKAAGPVMK